MYADWDYWGKPVPGFGDPEAQLLVVGLAPAAHGGNRTGRMFTGDGSADWLIEALYDSASPTSPRQRTGTTVCSCTARTSPRPPLRPAAKPADGRGTAQLPAVSAAGNRTADQCAGRRRSGTHRLRRVLAGHARAGPHRPRHKAADLFPRRPLHVGSGPAHAAHVISS